LLLLSGIGLRAFKLDTIPGGMLSDEALVISSTTRAIEENKIHIYHKDHPHAESMHGLIQYILPVFTKSTIDSHRIYAFIFSLILLLVFFLTTKHLLESSRFSIWATSFLVLNFWNIFFSRIFCTITCVLIFIVISNYLFIKVITKPNRKLLLLLILTNILGFLYFTSFRIIILHQFLLFFVFGHNFKHPYRTLITSIGFCIVFLMGLMWISDTPISQIISRGISDYSRVKADTLTNIFYSVFLPIVKPPIWYSYYSEKFMGSDMTYALYGASSFFVLGYVQTICLFGGIILGIKSWVTTLKKERFFSSFEWQHPHNIAKVTTSSLAILFILIVGIAGPSYGRLLPMVLFYSFIQAFFVLKAFEYLSSKGPQLQRWGTTLFSLFLLFMPIESFCSLEKLETNNTVGLAFHKNTVRMLEKLKAENQPNSPVKYVYCAVSYYVCKYYQSSIPNLKIFTSNINLKILKYTEKGSEIKLYWPQYPPYKTFYFSRQTSVPLHLDKSDFKKQFNIIEIQDYLENDQKVYSEIRLKF